MLIFFDILLMLIIQLGVGSFDNTWVWTAAEGPDGLKYEVYIQFDTSPWAQAGIVDGLEYHRVSVKPEKYRIKVRAVDEANNTGPFSDESVWLIIKPFTKPGTPGIKTITVNIDAGK